MPTDRIADRFHPPLGYPTALTPSTAQAPPAAPARVAPVRTVATQHRSRPHSVPRRVAVLSLHTSPLDQPGTGDAGGMNVYVVELSRQLASLGIKVDIFTRATSSEQPPVVELDSGVSVRHVTAGPFEELPKQDLPGQLCALASGVLRVEAERERGFYDVVHSHYWLSGQVGWLAKERWGVPLVHSMHTMAKVKNASLAAGDAPEPALRVIGETQVVEQSDRLIANTATEASQLVELYGADPDRVSVVHPGVDLGTFRPGDQAAARARLGLPVDATVLLFVGRIQPLKAPDLLVRAAAAMVAADPSVRSKLVVAIVGGPSGASGSTALGLQRLANGLGIGDLMRMVPPARHAELAHWYRAASLTVVPSYSESFGLVAVESQACGTPVVAATSGGLTTAVRDGETGLLVPDQDPLQYAAAIHTLVAAPDRLRRMGAAARQHAEHFGWPATAAATADVYSGALAAARGRQRLALAASG